MVSEKTFMFADVQEQLLTTAACAMLHATHPRIERWLREDWVEHWET
jgi:hypothetical protein